MREKNQNRLYIIGLLMAVITLAILSANCDSPDKQPEEPKATTVETGTSAGALPEPYTTKSVYNFSKVIGWPQDRTPSAPSPAATTMKFMEDRWA